MKKDVSWLAESFYNAMYPLCKEDTISDANMHAQLDRIGDVFVEHGRISSRFTSDSRRTVRVLILIDELADSDWYKFYVGLSASPYVLSRVLSASMPKEILAVFSKLNISLIPEMSSFKMSVDDEVADINDSRVLAVLEKFVGDLLIDPYLLCKLLGRSHSDIVKGIKDLLLEQGLFNKQNVNAVETAKVDLGDFFVGGVLPGDIVVKADELPASLLRRLDFLFPDAQDALVDKNLELAYERVSRLAQSLARFM